jgi:two-component system probable response regulator PhcQ
MRKILLVDDEINVLNALQRAVRRQLPPDQLRIELFVDPRAALRRCGECSFDIVISDFRMPAMDGIELLCALKVLAPATVRIILSASSEVSTVMAALNEAEAFRFIHKPWQDEDVVNTIALAFQHRDGALEQQRLADLQRVQSGALSEADLAARQLSADEPDLLKVNWGPNGEILL